MRLFFSFALLCLFTSCSSADGSSSIDECVNMIKTCMVNSKGIEEVKHQGVTYTEVKGEACFSLAINIYCGVDFDIEVNQWWQDISDWINSSAANRKKIEQLSIGLHKEAVNTASKDLEKIASRFIDRELLEDN